ncbi:ABC transporter substrate-binding protein [Bradyrhizobium sp. USDA 4451]
MYKIDRRTFVTAASAAALFSSSRVGAAEKKYDDGVSDTEIKIGHTCPYSGPASSYGVIGKAHQAYWKAVNDRGGINGRKINFISYDDGYSPPKTVEMVRKLVEEDKVLCIFNALGTAPNTAIRKYLNAKKVPHLYVGSGWSGWGDPKHFPWTIGYQPDFQTEAAIYAKHIMATIKDAKIGILMQNDDFGKDYFEGFKKALGNKTDQIVQTVTYESTDPTVDSQIIQLKASGANVLFSITIPKFTAQAIRKAADIGWKPVHYIDVWGTSVATAMKPAGFENCQGIITSQYLMDPSDHKWDGDADMKAWREFMAQYMPGANTADMSYPSTYSVDYLMEQTLKRCGDDLTRANLMKQATSFQDFKVPLLIPGITVSTSDTDFYPIQALQLARFQGESWEQFGSVIHADNS